MTISTTVAQVATINAGHPLRVSADALQIGDVSLVQLKNVQLGQAIDWTQVCQVTLPGKKTPAWLQSGDILFAARSAHPVAHCIDQPPRRSCCSPHFFVVKVQDTQRLDPTFLAWQINQRKAQAYFRVHAVGSSAKNVRRTTLENLPIVIPSLHTQRVLVQLQQAANAEKKKLHALIHNRQQQIDAIAAGLLTASGDTLHG